MRFHPLRTSRDRGRLRHGRTRYRELTAECCDELALIVDRRRNDPIKF